MSCDEPVCFKCGRPADIFHESFWDDASKRYVGYCQSCQRSDMSAVQVLQLTIRLHLERAYAYLPKKRKSVTS